LNEKIATHSALIHHVMTT